MGTDEAIGSAPRFMDLLRQLADEHHREVQKLNNEVARLQQVCDEMTFSNIATHQQPLSTDPEMDEALPDEGALTAAFFVAKEVNKAQKFGRQHEDNGSVKPDKDALETALGLASLGDNQVSDGQSDAFPLQEVDDIIPADDVPVKIAGARASSGQRARFEASLDGEQSTVSPPGEMSARFSNLRATQSCAMWSSGVLEGWGALINAVRTKQRLAALPTLSDVWKQLSEAQAADGAALSRQGMFQLDMLVARATHLNLAAIDEFGQRETRRKRLFGADGWLRRSWTRTILHPTCPQRVCWDVCGIVLLVHDLVFIPMQVFDTGTEGMPTEYLRFQDVFDKISASFWTVDIGVSFRTGFYSAEGFVELHPWPVAQNYAKSWLPMDLIIVCTDWCTMFLGMSSAAGFMRLGKSISRFMRVIRLLRFLKMNRALKEITERINSEYLLQVMGIMKTLVLIIIINHYIACAWYGLGCMGLISRWPDKFLVNYPDSFGYAYTTSLHWSLTQFTPASMEVVPQNPMERFFVIGVIIVALVAFSSFVSSITAAMTHIRTINAQKVKMEATIRQFFSEHKISHAMASRVWHFLKKNRVGTIKRLKEVDIPAFKMLPEKIKEDLRVEIYLPIVTLHPLFAEYGKREQYAMQRMCNEALEEKSMPVGEELWRDVDAVQKMLFVVQGKLGYYESLARVDLSEEEEEEDPMEVQVGQWACEICLWANKAVLPGVFMALTGGCELVLLSSESFQEIVCSCGGSIPFLVKYASIFMNGFQSASTECQESQFWSNTDILFNNLGRADEYVGLATGTRRKSAPRGRRTNYKSFYSASTAGGTRSTSSEDIGRGSSFSHTETMASRDGT